jgi:hypothetical protein
MPKRSPLDIQAGDSARDAEQLRSARLDEVLTLMSREQDTVLIRTLPSFEDENRILVTEGRAQWQVEVEEQTFNGRGDVKSTPIGYADLQINFKLASNEFAQERSLMIVCRPKLVSAADTLRLLNRLSKRERRNAYGDKLRDDNEVWAVATDDDSMRDIFEGNGYKYICTKWNDIDGWGRTNRVVGPSVGKNQQEQQWVLLETDWSGVTSTITTSTKEQAIDWFLQMVYLFVHAFPKNEFRVIGSDHDAALEGLRMTMCLKEDVGKDDVLWYVPIQICKAMGLEVVDGLGDAGKSAVAGGFEMLGFDLTRMLEGKGATLEADELERLSHSWPALMYFRDTSSLMAKSVKKTMKAIGKKRMGAAESLWKAAKRIRVSTVTTAVIQEQ